MSTCINCGAKLTGRYCAACGQPVKARLTLVSVLRSSVAAFFDTDSGFLATLLGLFIRPGIVVSNYVEGKTVPYVHPGRYLIVAIAALQITIGITGGIGDFAAGFAEASGGLENLSQTQQDSEVLVQDFLFVVMLLGLPLTAAIQRLVFWRSVRNFVEHFVCVTYIYAQQTVVTNLLLISDVLLPRPGYIFSILFFAIPGGLYVWTLVVFTRSGRFLGTLKGLLMLALSMIVNVIVVAFVLGVIRGIYNAAGA